jgi:superfamily I DNA/RNA helicase
LPAGPRRSPPWRRSQTITASGARAALSHLERSLFEARAMRAPDPAGAVRLLEGAGERAELELVAGEIAALLEGGMAPQEIAVVARVPGTNAELLADVFRQAGVSYALTRRRRLADTALGRALVGVLRCGTNSGTLGHLLAWLRAPGLLEHPELADKLELQARRSGATSAAQARALAPGHARPARRSAATWADRADRPRRARASVAVLRAP